MTTAIYDIAKGYLGLEEFPGAKHNPKIVQMYADSGNAWVHEDETPWCAAFVGSVLAQAGIKGTGKLNARSYLNWGQAVELDNAQRGDVVVLERGKDPASGHVAFYDGPSPRKGYIHLLGGNQGNKVSVAEFPISRILGVRRAPLISVPAPKKERTHVAQSTTVQASAVQLASGLGGGVAAVGALDGRAQIVAIVLCAVIVAAAAWVMRERIKKWANGIR